MITVFCVVFAILFLIVAGTTLFNVLYMDDNLFIEDNLHIDTYATDTYATPEYEAVAIDYVHNYLNIRSYETFDKLTSLDMEAIYADAAAFKSGENTYTTEYTENQTDISAGFAQAAKEKLISDFAQAAETAEADITFYFETSYERSTTVTSSSRLDKSDLYALYFDYTDAYLDFMGKSTSDYTEYNDVYEVFIEISTETDTGSSYNNYTSVVVADNGNGYEVIYDDCIIESLLSNLYLEVYL